MNIFVKIKPIDPFTRSNVKVYTIHVGQNEEWREEWEFVNWINKQKKNKVVENEFQEITRWIRVISEGKHDLSRLLRSEEKAHALPPETRFLEINFEKNLRLYCMIIGQKTIILFNGGIKSTAKAQEVPTLALFLEKQMNFPNIFKKQFQKKKLKWITKQG